jgi:hypothetical protein
LEGRSQWKSSLRSRKAIPSDLKASQICPKAVGKETRYERSLTRSKKVENLISQ